MQFIINHSSMEPIYEQIMGQIRSGIAKGTMKEGDALPSVRALAKDLKVSALPLKRPMTGLEQEGFIMTVHGKGSFVTCSGQDIYLEERRREVEEELAAAVRKGRSCPAWSRRNCWNYFRWYWRNRDDQTGTSRKTI